MNLTKDSLIEMLSRRSVPGLSLAQLRDMIAHEQGYLTPGPRLRSWLRSESEGFRLLDPWLGPWRAWTTESHLSAVLPSGRGDPEEADDTWVVPREVSPSDHPPRRCERIGVAIRALGLRVDAGSPALLARWVFLVQEGAKWSERPASPPEGSIRAGTTQQAA